MATFGQILSNLSIAASQSFRRNSGDSAFEAFEPIDLTASQTMTNKTFTSPKVGTAINDTNGNELIKVTATASAVNEVTLTNAATGNDVDLSATGGDTNIGLRLNAKGDAFTKIKVLYRDNGSSTYQSNTVFVRSWGFILGDGDDAATGTVTFGVTFDAIPTILVSSIGNKASDPTGPGDFTANVNDASVSAMTTTNFVVALCNVRGSTYTSSIRLGYNCLAIGVIT